MTDIRRGIRRAIADEVATCMTYVAENGDVTLNEEAHRLVRRYLKLTAPAVADLIMSVSDMKEPYAVLPQAFAFTAMTYSVVVGGPETRKGSAATMGLIAAGWLAAYSKHHSKVVGPSNPASQAPLDALVDVLVQNLDDEDIRALQMAFAQAIDAKKRGGQ